MTTQSMDTPFRKVNIEWLFEGHPFSSDSINANYVDKDIGWFEYPISADIGSGGFSSLKLSSGLSLHRSILEFSDGERGKYVPFGQIDVKLREPALFVQCALSGTAQRTEANGHGTYLLNHENTLIRVDDQAYTFRLDVATGGTIEILSLIASQSALNILLGSSLADSLLESVRRHPTQIYHLPAAVQSPLHFCFDPRLEGALHKLHAQSKALEFLDGLLQYMAGILSERPVAKAFRAGAVRDYIREAGAVLPAASEVARVFGVSPRTLNATFLDAFGMTVSRYIKEQRLTIAHELLTSTTRSIREVSSQLGYSQISNFSASFKAFFGYSPTTLRQKPVRRSDVSET